MVTEQNRHYALLVVKGVQRGYLQIEELCVPVKSVPRLPFNWKRWVEKGAGGHVSWSLLTLDLERGEVVATNRLRNGQWQPTNPTGHLLATLLTLPFSPIPKGERRCIGNSSTGHRTTWQPRLVVEGEEKHSPSFTAWRTHWPMDKSPMEGRTVELFLPEEGEDYPSYLPYWIETSNTIGATKMRVIDSGRELHSPTPFP